MRQSTGMWLVIMLFLTGFGSADGGDGTNTIEGEIRVLNQEGMPKQNRSNLVVYLESGTAAASVSNREDNPQISQRGRRFRPRVLAVEPGTEVDFLNDDRVLHNVFSLSRSQPFDLGDYERGGKRSVRFQTPGSHRVYCNLHSSMVLNVLVLETPYHATTDESGRYSIKGIPDGTYDLTVWGEFSDEVKTTITLSGGEVQSRDFTIAETRTSVQHTNKFGRPYRGKY